MKDAPKSINNFSTKIENEGKQYEITLSQKSNNLLIISKELNSFPSKIYEEEFSKDNLNQISKFFKLFEDISDIFTELKKKIEEKKFKIKINENNFIILLKVDITNINELSLELKRKEEDIKSMVVGLCKTIKKQEETIKKLEEESNNKIKKLEEEFNKKIKQLEEEKIESNNKIKKLIDEENESNNKIKKLEEEFNKKIKQFEDKSNNKIKQFEDESNNKIKQIEIKDINNLLKIFKGSRVLSNNNEEIMISNWIKPNSKIKVNLLYQISRDGDNISTFYNKVKNKYPTLILIKSKSGYKFGGYTTQTWEITDIYKKDELSFLFSLNKQKKYNIKKNHIQYAIYGDRYYFAFGGSSDLHIYDQCTSNNNSFCNPYSYNTTEEYELNDGECNFYVDELEVYNVEFE